jgi:DNA-binding NarL/FixJ family response regulator
MPKILLIVDDDKFLCDASKALIARLDSTIDIRDTTSPSEAVEIVRNNPVDCIISDFMMPEMNGLELLERIRSEGYQKLFYILTGHPTELIRPQAVQLGVSAIYQKGFSFSIYHDVVQRLNGR